MKQISNKEYEEFHKYKSDKLNGRILTPDGLRFIIEVNEKELTEAARDDYSTFDILKEYYQDEEEDMYWGQAQLEMIECIGEQNWLLRQL